MVAVKPANRELFAHLAMALGRYAREIQRDGIAAPADLVTLADFFADCARVRPDATPLADTGASGHGGPMRSHLLLTKREAAAELRVSVRQLERVLANPDSGLESVRVEGAVRISRQDLESYIAALSSRSFRNQIEEKTA